LNVFDFFFFRLNVSAVLIPFDELVFLGVVLKDLILGVLLRFYGVVILKVVDFV
jgi:hypothetical protein